MSMDMSDMATATSSMAMAASTSASSMSMDMMMTPYLHFTGGDNLFFKTLTPSSHGAIAGACIVLGFLAILERWVAGVRGVLDAYWARRAQDQAKTKVAGPGYDASKFDASKGDVDSVEETPVVKRSVFRSARTTRLSPSFAVSHDVPRGLVFAFQAFLAYVLMLAVMTFQAAYIISIIVGLGIGEVLFGRLGSARGHILH